MKLRLADLRAVAMDYPGMWDAFMKAGHYRGDVLEIEREEFDKLNAYYFKGVQLGTALHNVLKPVVRALDAVVGASLRDCPGCAGRELKKLNAASASTT